jgi:hypothetical protein
MGAAPKRTDRAASSRAVNVRSSGIAGHPFPIRGGGGDLRGRFGAECQTGPPSDRESPAVHGEEYTVNV